MLCYLVVLVSVLVAPSIKSLPVEPEESVYYIAPVVLDNVTHVTGVNQYQKLYPSNGKYQFGYQTADQFRVEAREGNGQVRGVFASVDENGTISAYRYGFDGVRYKQVPFKLDEIPDNLRLPETAQQVSPDSLDHVLSLIDQ